MYHLFGFDENVANISTLSMKYGKIKTGEGLRKAYKSFLDDYQPQIPHPNPPFPHFVDSGKTKTVTVQKALFSLSKKSPQLYTLLTLAVHTLFLREANNSNGGPTSNALGVISIHNQEEWSLQDMEELLIRELTHHLLSIDALCHPHTQDETFFLKERLHNMVASTEILLSRRFFLGDSQNSKRHPPTTRMKKNLIEDIDSVYALPNVDSLLTERGLALLARCKNTVAELSPQ